MIKTILSIDGMACGMCESHVNDAVRRAFKTKKVTSSHKKGTAEIITEDPLDEKVLKEIMKQMGYTVMEVHAEPYEKKKMFGFIR